MCCVSGSALEECAFVARRRRSQKVNELCLPNRVRREGGEKETGERRVGSLLTVNDGCRIESCRPNETGRSNRSVCWCAPRLSHPWKDLKNPQRQPLVCQRTGLYLHCFVYVILFYFFCARKAEVIIQRAGPFRPRTSYRAQHAPPAGTEAADPGEKRGPGAAERREKKAGLSQTPGFVREGVRRIYGGEVARRGNLTFSTIDF